MIYLQMSGRLGNQFFRYAAARALQIRYYPDEKIVINYQQKVNGDESFYNMLREFNVTDFIEDNSGTVLARHTSLSQKMICVPYLIGMKNIKPEQMNQQVEYEKHWEKLLKKYGVYWFRRGGWKFEKSNQKNKVLSGNFEDPVYFNDIREILLNEFTPKHEILDKNIELYNRIVSTNSVCISVRRGDFESNKTFKNLHSLCNKEYFTDAIDKIKKKVENPVFFMFSDDIQWVRENVNTGCLTFYEDGTDPVWEKLRLMSACKHFVISNSTFSWWTQYLSRNENKIVVSPSRWFNNDYKSPLIDKNWIRIEV
ncbi:MAG TPA: alpha-1,2-fucosyltransferase [Fusicatenibacter saccharivorans]|nr:alpha-1,2-fucosyltransferase [Fusicatenibacter saccharivorans]